MRTGVEEGRSHCWMCMLFARSRWTATCQIEIAGPWLAGRLRQRVVEYNLSGRVAQSVSSSFAATSLHFARCLLPLPSEGHKFQTLSHSHIFIRPPSVLSEKLPYRLLCRLRIP